MANGLGARIAFGFWIALCFLGPCCLFDAFGIYLGFLFALFVLLSLFKSRDGTNSFSLSSSPVFFIISHRRLVSEGNSNPTMTSFSIRGCKTYKQKTVIGERSAASRHTKSREHTVTPASTLKSVSSSGSHASLQIPVAASVITGGHCMWMEPNLRFQLSTGVTPCHASSSSISSTAQPWFPFCFPQVHAVLQSSRSLENNCPCCQDDASSLFLPFVVSIVEKERQYQKSTTEVAKAKAKELIYLPIFWTNWTEELVYWKSDYPLLADLQLLYQPWVARREVLL